MSVGSICYATWRGISNLCRDFHAHGIIQNVCVVDHPGIPMNRDWYPDAPIVGLRNLDYGVMRDFCDQHTSMLFFETPWDWRLISHCRAKGIKTTIITMYECSPDPKDIRPEHIPDYWFCPSLLDMSYFAHGSPGEYVKKFEQYAGVGGNTALFTPLPCEYPWKLRTKAEHFVANHGYLGVRGREGTENLIDAMQYVKSPIRLTVRVQENVSAEGQRKCAADSRIEYLPETLPRNEMYLTGDVAVGAQKWNGCSLPLQEARASGMLVMNTDRFPMNSWLPREPLIPVDHYVKGRIASRCMEYEEAVVTPLAIADKIDQFYETDITEYSQSAISWAKTVSWEVLGPKYKELLS